MSICLARKAFFSSGKTSNKSMGYGHGYNYTVEVVLEGDKDPVSGLVINLSDVDIELKKTVAKIDHVFLGKASESPLSGEVTTRDIAQYFWDEFSKSPLKQYLKRINLTEGNDLTVTIELALNRP